MKDTIVRKNATFRKSISFVLKYVFVYGNLCKKYEVWIIVHIDIGKKGRKFSFLLRSFVIKNILSIFSRKHRKSIYIEQEK